MRQKEVKELLKKYSDGTATTEEKALVEAWYEQYDTSEQVISEAHLQSLEDEVFQRLPITQPIPVRKLSPRLIAAASVLVILSFGAYLFWHKKDASQQTAQNQVNDIKPGGNKATLTLSNGQKISLTDARNGKLATQANVIVKKTADGKITYAPEQDAPAESGNTLQYNTMTTPRGGRYEATLADGTHFVLDAASSIRYPVKFTGKERLVEVTGQIYFEVKYNRVHPFKVKLNNQVIEDLGTVFNVNAYNDESSLKTTLLEGSVKISTKDKSSVLKPGQQASISPETNVIQINEADIDEAVAWKNGDFDFNGEKIESIMRKLSRWYNIDVVYNDENIRSKTFTGKISRFKNISQVLKMLGMTKAIHFKVEGRRVIVTH